MKYITNEDELKKKCEDETIRENLNRNKILIDMDNLPKKYNDEINEKFTKLVI